MRALSYRSFSRFEPLLLGSLGPICIGVGAWIHFNFEVEIKGLP